jgi:hypothetical protein
LFRTPVISPLLANVYLHYVFDLWVEAWRQKVASRQVVVVGYADDLAMGFQSKADAERFLTEFRERLAKFGWNFIQRKRGYWRSAGLRLWTGASEARRNRRRSRFSDLSTNVERVRPA